jgi:hypothetical protein
LTEELSDLIFLSPEEEEAVVAVEEAEAVEASVEVEVSEEIEVVVEVVASVEAEDSEEEEVEIEVVEEEEEVEALVHQEEDSDTTPVELLTVKCYERFLRHRVAESKYNNYNPSYFRLPIVAS